MKFEYETWRVRFTLGLVAIVCTPAIVGIIASILQLIGVVSVKASSWIGTCFMLTVSTTMFLVGIFVPIMLFVLFIISIKSEPSLGPMFTFALLVLMGGGLGFGAYHSFFFILEMFPKFIDGFTFISSS